MRQPGPECKINAAITVDVVRLNADVVAGSCTANDVVFCPAWVFVPDDRILGSDHDVGFSIAVQVGDRDRIADFAGVRVNLLRLKSREVGRNSRKRAQRESEHF